MTGLTGPRTTTALLGALTAAVLGGTALAAPPGSAVRLAPSGGGGRVALVAAAGVPVAAGTNPGDRHRDGDHGERERPRTRRVASVGTHATADVHRDDRTRRRSAWEVDRVRARLVVADNAATAVTRDCTDCHAVAVSVQVVVASGNAGSVRASNAADAVTLRCTRCAATALAYQFVVVGRGRLVLTRDARAELRDLRRQLRRAVRDAPQGEVPGRADAVASRIADVLRTGVVDRDRTPSAAPSAPSTLAAPAGDAVKVRVRRSHDAAHSRAG